MQCIDTSLTANSFKIYPVLPKYVKLELLKISAALTVLWQRYFNFPPLPFQNWFSEETILQSWNNTLFQYQWKLRKKNLFSNADQATLGPAIKQTSHHPLFSLSTNQWSICVERSKFSFDIQMSTNRAKISSVLAKKRGNALSRYLMHACVENSSA